MDPMQAPLVAHTHTLAPLRPFTRDYVKPESLTHPFDPLPATISRTCARTVPGYEYVVLTAGKHWGHSTIQKHYIATEDRLEIRIFIAAYITSLLDQWVSTYTPKHLLYHLFQELPPVLTVVVHPKL